MRKSLLLAVGMIGSLLITGCKPNGEAHAGSIMDGVGGNDVSGNTVAVANLKSGQEFLTKNKTLPGVRTTASGLQYAVTATGAGDGQQPNASSLVLVNYEGKLLDGTVFDSSFARGQAAEFVVGELIAGWVEALQLMRPGDEWTIWVPPSIGYGEMGSPPSIPPNAVLVFRMRLEKIVR